MNRLQSIQTLFLALVMLSWVDGALAFDHSHALWGNFLKKFVVESEHSSRVRYEDASKDRKDLDAYVSAVTGVSLKEYERWTPDQKQAVLINSYNALTVQLILDKGIPKSIKDIGSLFRKTWKIKFFKFLGEDSHLDHIEHELARAQFNNCRFHFAFNCASVGCPKLRAQPWIADKLKDQFESAAKDFVTDRERNFYDEKTQSLQLSKIFDWYAGDFSKDASCGGSVQAFVGRYLRAASGAPIDASTKVKYLDYNWKLNRAP